MSTLLQSDTSSAFIPFIMAGHPSREQSLQALLALDELKVSAIELGVPFSDPVADGVVNQAAAQVAIQNGMTLAGVLDLVTEARNLKVSTPLILFTYLNPILAMGESQFIHRANQAGVSAVLIVDLPPEEGESFYRKLEAAGLAYVLLLSPTTSASRYPLYRKLNPDFLYYISRLSVTGAKEALSTDLPQALKQLKTQFPQKKLVAGFGLSTPEHVKKVGSMADGVVVGSHLVRTLEHSGLKKLKKTVKALQEGLIFKNNPV